MCPAIESVLGHMVPKSNSSDAHDVLVAGCVRSWGAELWCCRVEASHHISSQFQHFRSSLQSRRHRCGFVTAAAHAEQRTDPRCQRTDWRSRYISMRTCVLTCTCMRRPAILIIRVPAACMRCVYRINQRWIGQQPTSKYVAG